MNETTSYNLDLQRSPTIELTSLGNDGKTQKMKRKGIKINGEGLCGKGGGNFDLSGFLDIVFDGFSPKIVVL